MSWPLDLQGFQPATRNRRSWTVLQLTTLLLPLLFISTLSCSFVLRRVNALGRRCIPPPPSHASDHLNPLHVEARIAVVSFSDESSGEGSNGGSSAVALRSFKGMMEMVKSNKESYCRRWGYDFIDARSSIDRSRPASWSKIPAVRSHLPRYDWIFWNDADSLVTNPNISLEEILQSTTGNLDFASSPDLIVTEDVNGINAGMFFFRRSAWSEEFLDSWWNLTTFIRRGSTRSGDNFALIHLIESMNPVEMRKHVHVASMQCLFNSYMWFPTWKSFYRLILYPLASWKGAYSRGDFMVHLAGLDDKTGWAAKILREMEVPA